VLRLLTPLRLASAGLAVLVAVIVVLVAQSSNHYLEIPDEAHPLEALVKVPGAKTENDGGDFYYVDIVVKRASMLESLLPFIRPDGADLVDRDLFVQPGISDKQRFAVELAAMKISQQIASAVALRELGYDIPVRAGGVRVVAVTADSHASGVIRNDDVIVRANGRRVLTRQDLAEALANVRVGEVVRIGVRRRGQLRTFAIRTTSDESEPRRALIGVLPIQALRVRFPFPIRFDLGRVGGPSAGLAFALELMEKRGRDIDRGYKVAATGEIQLDGTVTRIGGVKQKTIGARQADVDVFLVPRDGDNARVARRYANGLRIIPVESFQQALRALATLPRKD
jgi:PDZ domain-containing protein